LIPRQLCCKVVHLKRNTSIDVHAEIGEIITGKKERRSKKDEIIVYDATGTALQDVSAAAFIYEKAIIEDKGLVFEFPS